SPSTRAGVDWPYPVDQTSPLPVRNKVPEQPDRAPVADCATWTTFVNPVAVTGVVWVLVVPLPSSPEAFAPDPRMVPSGATAMRAVFDTLKESEVTGVARTCSL